METYTGGQEETFLREEPFLQGESFLRKAPNILYEDRAIVVVQKPAGILTCRSGTTPEAPAVQSPARASASLASLPGGSGASGTPTHAPEDLVTLLEEQGRREIHCVHRLDQPVGGVMVFAKDPRSAARLTSSMGEGRFVKEYRAVCRGDVAADLGEQGVLEDLLFKDSRKNKTFVVKKQRRGVRAARLSYRVLAVFSPSFTVTGEEATVGSAMEVAAEKAVGASTVGTPVLGVSASGDFAPETLVPETAAPGTLVPETRAPARSAGEKEPLSLVAVRLGTGRTHQIRVQFSSRGHALLGDGKYGGSCNRCEVALFAYRLSFPHPVTGKILTFSCPLPCGYPWGLFEQNPSPEDKKTR